MGRLYVRTPHALLDLPDVEVAAWTVKDLKDASKVRPPFPSQTSGSWQDELGDGMLLNDCNLQKEATNLLLVDGGARGARRACRKGRSVVQRRQRGTVRDLANA